MPIRERNVELPDGEILACRWKSANEKKIVSRVELSAFETEYKTGMMLAMIGKTILEGLCDNCSGNPNMMEQAMAGMAEGFGKELEIS